MKIGLDFDGVIADTSRLKREIASQIFGVDIPAEIFKEKLVVGRGILTLPQYRELMRRVCGVRECGLSMDEMPGAIVCLKDLIASGHGLKIITSREGQELEVAREWLKMRGLEPVMLSVGYGHDKVAATQDVQVFMDDDLNKLLPLTHLPGRSFLFHSVYNSGDELPQGIRRVTGWGEFRKILEGIYADQEI